MYTKQIYFKASVDVTYSRIIMNKMMMDIMRNTKDMAHPTYETIESALSSLVG